MLMLALMLLLARADTGSSANNFTVLSPKLADAVPASFATRVPGALANAFRQQGLKVDAVVDPGLADAARQCRDGICLIRAAHNAHVDQLVNSSVGRLRHGYVLTLAWMQPDGQVQGRSVTDLGSDPDKIDSAVQQAVKTLLAQGANASNAAAFASDRETCRVGGLQACARLAQVYTTGWGGMPVDLSQAATLLARRCIQDDPPGCFRLAMIVHYHPEALLQAQPPLERARLRPQIFRVLQRSCDDGSADGCLQWSALAKLQPMVKLDAQQQANLYLRACDRGAAVGCLNLAMAYERGDAVGAASGQAAHYYDLACKGGEVQGCRIVGQQLAAAGKDPGRAAALLTEACDDFDAAACHTLADLYQLPRTAGLAAHDPGEIRALRESACALGDASSCLDPGTSAQAEDDAGP